ncbi:MAG: hypothetical protein U5R06_04855 [candidate division KSB1 bacterium]|nr:hypothetical protein [candidate division KSB1 bacterium]
MQQSLYPIEEAIEALADHYAQLIIKNRLVHAGDESDSSAPENEQEPCYETVDLNSIENSKCRTLGAEYIGIAIFRELGLHQYLKKLNFTDQQVHLAYLSVVGRLVHPASERQTAAWARHLSATDELIGTDFNRLSHNALYRISDALLEQKEPLENHLARKEKDLFHLEEKIILYDLTNLEDAFRSLKSELGLRPVRPHKKERSDAHLFIGVSLSFIKYDSDKIGKERYSYPVVARQAVFINTRAHHHFDDDT